METSCDRFGRFFLFCSFYFSFTIVGIEGVAPTAYQNRMRVSTDDHHVEESHPSNSSTFHPQEDHHEVAMEIQVQVLNVMLTRQVILFYFILFHFFFFY